MGSNGSRELNSDESDGRKREELALIQIDSLETEDWFKTNIKKKECAHFVSRPNSFYREEVCYCGKAKRQHKHENTRHTEADWSREKHIEEMPTDAFGDLTFKGLGNKTAKYVRACNNTPPKVLYEMMTDQWQLKVPKLVISVTGGDNNFSMNPRLKNLFSQGLVKAAQSTGAWIITSGCHAGVAKLVGEAVRDFRRSGGRHHEIVTIGIAPWSTVHKRNRLIRKEGGLPAEYHVDVNKQDSHRCLDNNHSHFILVDDGILGDYWARIPLRTELERFISEQSVKEGVDMKIPIVSVVLAGGLTTLDNIHSCMTNRTPCVIVEGSGHVADIIAQVAEMDPAKTTLALMEEKLLSLLQSISSAEEINACTEKIQDIVRLSHLLTVFREDKGNAQYLDVTMALLKASQSKGYNNWAFQLKLALLWNRLDIAKNIFNSKWTWKPKDLYPVLTVALVENKQNFVQLFLDQGVRLRDYVTEDTLTKLYKNIQPMPSFSQKLEKKKIKKDQDENQEGINLLHVEEALKSLCKFPVPLYFTPQPETAVDITPQDTEGDTVSESSSMIERSPELKTRSIIQQVIPELNELNKSPSVTDLSPPSEIEYLIRDLLIWAVVQNRRELAEIIWTECQDCVMGALACSMIFRALSNEEEDTNNVEEMEALANLFEVLASGVFSECCRKDELCAEKLLTQKSLGWGDTTCLQVATNAEAMNFMSNGGVQTFLTKIWWGKLSKNNSFLRLFFCMAFFPLICTDFITFRENTEPAKDHTRKECHKAEVKRDTTTDKSGSKRWKESGTPGPLQRLCGFFSAPVVIFYYNVVSYIGFLWLFAHVLMVDFQTTPSWTECLLYVWIFSLLCEEVRQLFYEHEGMEFLTKGRMYLTDLWNLMDVVAIGLFTLGLVCRWITALFYAGRVILALDFILFCLRLMHIFTLSRNLGPKIIMMQKMTKDIFFFLFLLAVWVVSFGVSKQAILVHNEQRLDWIFRNVIYEPYLILFGQIPADVDILNFNNSTCTSDGSDASLPKCAEALDGVPIFPEGLTIVLLCVYLLFAIILLLNLLIAMFSNTFSEVQGNTDQIWKFQRQRLIKEYSTRPPVPPPFILLNHLYLLVKKLIPKKKNSDLGLESDENKTAALLSWEKGMQENYLQKHREAESHSAPLHIRATSNKVDALAHLLESEQKRASAMEQQVFLSLKWIMESLTEKGFASKEKAPGMVSMKSSESEEPTCGDKPLDSRSEYHVHSRQLMYPGSNVERYPVPDELVPWEMDFPLYDPPLYMAEKEGRETHNPWIQNPGGRTGIKGLGSLMWSGPNRCLHPVLTRWKKNKDGSFVLKDSKRVIEVLAVKREGSERWGLPGGILRPDEKLPTTLKDILKEESWEMFEALLEKRTEVYNGYLDDPRNTDDAWVEICAIIVHLESPEDLTFLELNLCTLESAYSICWLMVDEKMPLYANMKDILREVARKLNAHY